MRTSSYDVFISYRREGGSDLAEVVCKHLKTRGYRVFLDVRETPAGPFDESLTQTIESTPDFVVLLTDGCFDRCHSADDWFRTEIAHALATGRNVVPLRVEDFEFPPQETLPDQIAQLPRHQNIRYIREHCDATIDDLCRRLLSTSRVTRGRMAIRSVGLAGILGVLAWVLWGIFSSRPPEKWVTPPAKSLPAQVAQLPAAEVLRLAYGDSPPAAPSQAQRPALQLEILARRVGETTFSRLDDGHTLASQTDDYFIALRPLSPGFLYIFQVDSLGKRAWLFPQNKTSSYSSGSNPVKPQEILQVPSAGSKRVLFLDDNVGIEHIYAVFSATRWPELEEALGRPAGPSAHTESEPHLLATVVRAPNGLAGRGVGGVRVEESLTGVGASFIVERTDRTQTYSLPVSAQPLQASGSFLVVERWFRHVAR